MDLVIAEYAFIAGEAPVSLKLTVHGTEKKNEVVLLLTVSHLQLQPHEATFNVDVNTQTVSLVTTSLSTASTLAVCLLTCGLTAVVPEVIKCLKSAKPPKAKNFIACMKKKGVSILASVAECAVNCVAGAVTDSSPSPPQT